MENLKNDLTTETVVSRIYTVRNLRVMLDSDLAELYEVPTKRFNEQVKRNISRFPVDFMFQLTQEEYDSLRSQNATSKPGRGGRRYLPYVFTENGAIMAATILNSQRAVEMSVFEGSVISISCSRHHHWKCRRSLFRLLPFSDQPTRWYR